MATLTPRAELYKVSFSGQIGPNEIFVYSQWTTSDNTNDQANVVANYATDVSDLLATTVSGGGVPTWESAFPDYVVWDQIKCSWWNTTTNKLQAGSTPAYLTISENGNGSAGSGLPDQCALAVTTRSVAAGRRKYNRYYLPPLTINATDGRGLLGVQEANALVLWRHLNIVSHDAAGDTQCNWNPAPGGGIYGIVDIYLGRRLDIIRRRANHEPEPRVIDTL